MPNTTPPPIPHTRRFSETALLWLTVGFVTIWNVGLHVDTWYHSHHGFEIESFFTLTHALLYGGAAGTGLVVALYLLESIWRGVPRSAWLPKGFALVLLGTILFGLGGPADALWHETFGFEADLEALLSPTHIWLVVSMLLALAGLLRAAVAYRGPPDPRYAVLRSRDVPVVLPIAFLFNLLLFFIAYSQPLVVDYPASNPVNVDIHGVEQIERGTEAAAIAGTTGIAVHSLLLALFLVVPLRSLVLPTGAITLIVLPNALFEVAATDMWLYLPAVVGAVLVGEVLWLGIRHDWFGGTGGLVGYWALAFVVPFITFTLYLGIAWLNGGIHWSTHIWAGTPFLAGLYGLIGSLFVTPHRFLQRATRPEERDQAKPVMPELEHQRDRKRPVPERV